MVARIKNPIFADSYSGVFITNRTSPPRGYRRPSGERRPKQPTRPRYPRGPMSGPLEFFKDGRVTRPRQSRFYPDK